MFKLKREIGIGEIIALLALLVSGIALYQSNRANSPYVVHGSGTILATTVKEKGKCSYILSLPVQFHNSGNRAVTLRRYVPSDTAAVMFLDGSSVHTVQDDDYELYESESSLDHSARELWLKKVRSTLEIDLKSYAHTDTLIPPGGQYMKHLVLIVKPYSVKDRDFENIAFTINAEFGNDQEINVNFLTAITPLKCRSSDLI